jgi:hypothetical protein
MTRMERARLMIEDYDTYQALVPEGHWLQLLDGIADLEGLEEAHEHDEAWKKVHQLVRERNKRYRKVFD